MRHAFVLALAASPFLMAPSLAAAGGVGYVLGNGGTTLHSFSLSSPGSASTISLTFNGRAASLDDIDFRPLTGQLYGYDDVADTYYRVDLKTGELIAASGSEVTPTNSDKLGIDFNPVIDRLRTVTELGENIVYNPVNGTASDVATVPLFYADGDPNSGIAPQVVANAYTNSVFGTSAASTTQYVLDSNLNTLATLANNAGTLMTVGQIRVNGEVLDFDSDSGFDILAAPGDGNIAYAVFNVGNVAGLYSIDLSSGNATSIGEFSRENGTIRGLATAIPEPSSIVLCAIGVAGLAASRIRGLNRKRNSLAA